MNRSLIDTDILSYYFRGDEEVKRNLRDYLNFFDKIETSIITHYEIVGGLLAKDAKKQLKIYEIFISQNSIMPLTEKSVSISAELYGKLKQTGNVIENIDLLIAGVAIENEMTLVTNNESHFARLSEISDLKIENWKKK
ncbi:MAG: type II toxin-antitoxin system VapC family toxin [Ekhidna sp.]|nr:type II toxin-antitoxin system VapC family toxin [Ekhidna sp.]